MSAPRLLAPLAGFPRPASHDGTRCAFGSATCTLFAPCRFCRSAVSEHLARQPKAACSYEGCTEASVRACDACDAPRCGQHVRGAVAYGSEGVFCLGGCSLDRCEFCGANEVAVSGDDNEACTRRCCWDCLAFVPGRQLQVLCPACAPVKAEAPPPVRHEPVSGMNRFERQERFDQAEEERERVEREFGDLS